jgi:hypothetical protein
VEDRELKEAATAHDAEDLLQDTTLVGHIHQRHEGGHKIELTVSER